MTVLFWFLACCFLWLVGVALLIGVLLYEKERQV